MPAQVGAAHHRGPSVQESGHLQVLVGVLVRSALQLALARTNTSWVTRANLSFHANSLRCGPLNNNTGLAHSLYGVTVSLEVRYRRLVAHMFIRVPIRCVATDTTQIG